MKISKILTILTIHCNEIFTEFPSQLIVRNIIHFRFS